MKKKVLSIALAAVMAMTLAGCGNKINPDEKRYAFITDSAGIGMNEFSQPVWEGVQEYSGVRPCVATSYTAEEDTAKAFKSVVKQAVKDGAKIVVTAGEEMDYAVYNAAKDNKKVSFALIEGTPMTEEQFNEAGLGSEEESVTFNTNMDNPSVTPSGTVSAEQVDGTTANTTGDNAGDTTGANESGTDEGESSEDTAERSTVVVGGNSLDGDSSDEASADDGNDFYSTNGMVVASTQMPLVSVLTSGEQVIASETVGAQNLVQNDNGGNTLGAQARSDSGTDSTADETDSTVTEDNGLAENLCVVKISRRDEGFLAGYVAVAEGHTNIGFMAGPENDDSIAYCNGFIAGANAAAAERMFADGGVTVHTKFFEDENLSPVKMNETMKWVQNGVEMIFTLGDGVTRSAAKGMDVAGSGSIVTTDAALKTEIPRITFTVGRDYKQAAINILEAFEHEEFPGGTDVTYGIGAKCVVIDDYTGLAAFTGTTLETLRSNINLGNVLIGTDDVRGGTAKVSVVDGVVAADESASEASNGTGSDSTETDNTEAGSSESDNTDDTSEEDYSEE